jgi:hypothetical protein
MSDEPEPEPFNDVIRNRLSDRRRQAREALFPAAETEPAESGENEEKTDG